MNVYAAKTWEGAIGAEETITLDAEKRKESTTIPNAGIPSSVTFRHEVYPPLCLKRCTVQVSELLDQVKFLGK